MSLPSFRHSALILSRSNSAPSFSRVGVPCPPPLVSRSGTLPVPTREAGEVFPPHPPSRHRYGSPPLSGGTTTDLTEHGRSRRN